MTVAHLGDLDAFEWSVKSQRLPVLPLFFPRESAVSGFIVSVGELAPPSSGRVDRTAAWGPSNQHCLQQSPGAQVRQPGA